MSLKVFSSKLRGDVGKLNNNKRRISILWVECSLRKRERERERLMWGGEQKECHEIVSQLKQNILD
jgi:hypothetical protein